MPAVSSETPAVHGIIDPLQAYPGDGSGVNNDNGRRYLILKPLPLGGTWGNVSADKYDIIESNGATWSVSFDASSTTDIKYTKNTNDQKIWKWNGTNWISAVEANYPTGFWRIYL